MPGIAITRHDFRVGIAARKSETIELMLDWDGNHATARLSAVDALLALGNPESQELGPGLFATVDIKNAFASFRASAPSRAWERLSRVTLQIDDARLAPLHWESFFRAAAGPSDIPIVRVSPVRPRVAQLPF